MDNYPSEPKRMNGDERQRESRVRKNRTHGLVDEVRLMKTASANSLRPRGFTLIELLVVVAVVAILASLLLPALNKARGQANDAKCLNNLRQLNSGVLQYADDYNGICPNYSGWGYNGGIPWQTVVVPYLGIKERRDVSTSSDSWLYSDNGKWKPVTELYLCPAQKTSGTSKKYYYGKHYGINFEMSWPHDGNNMYLKRVRRPSERFLLADIDTDSNSESTSISGNSMFGVRHVSAAGTSLSFADGHAEKRRYHEIPIRGNGVYFWGWKCEN